MVSTGIAMEIHYCMGERSGIDFFSGKDDKCGKCGMTEKKGGCCSNEKKFYKLEDNFKHPSNEYEFSYSCDAIAENHVYTNTALLSNAPVSDSRIESPPKLSGPSIYIRNRVFRL